MSRKLDTGDQQDIRIINDAALVIAPTRFISAWGDTSYVGYHGLNRARGDVRLFGDTSAVEAAEVLEESLSTKADGSFEITEDRYRIPDADTTYHHVCETFSALKNRLNLPQGQDMLTMIGAMPVITEETAVFVHHFTVYLQENCSGGAQSGLTRTMVWGWAPGDAGYELPDDVGFPMFHTADHQAIDIQIHYNNPTRISGKTDSSGVRFYYTTEERDQRAGMLELADPYVMLDGKRIDSGLTKWEFSCPGSCSSLFLGNNGVTVLTECK